MKKSRVGGRPDGEVEAAVVDGLLRQFVHEVAEVFVEVAAEVGPLLGVHLAEGVDRERVGLDVLLLLFPLRVQLVLLLGLDDLALQRMVLHYQIARVHLVR